MVALFVLLTFIIFIGINAILIKRREKLAQAEGSAEAITDYPVFTKDSILIPQGFYFSKGHTWTKIENNGAIKLGIDDFLNKVLNKISFKDVVQPGTKVKKGDVLFKLELNGKLLRVFSPINGEVVEINNGSISDSSVLSENPYEKGWLFKIEPTNLKEDLHLLSIGKDVVKWMHDELTRLKDFVSVAFAQKNLVGATMYDGGNFVEGVIKYLPESEIEKFEKDFLSL